MKVGFNTMIWGFQLEDIRNVLDTIANAGYQGVEFGQRPDGLGVDTVEELMALLDERDLEFVGLYSGTLKERVDFCKNSLPAHLLLEHWDLDHAPYAIEKGFTLALHPSRFTSFSRSEDAFSLAEANQELNLKIILDTVHMTIAGEDPIRAIMNTKDRLAAVHFKDWSPEFGRFSHRYGNSLRELGKGIVKLDSVLRALQEMEYDEFVIWFRDYGPGIEYEMEEAIFKEGFRTPAAIERDVTGQGVGLWVVRQVIEAHEGRIEVTNRQFPTEFTIYLPESLAQRPPKQHHGEPRK